MSTTETNTGNDLDMLLTSMTVPTVSGNVRNVTVTFSFRLQTPAFLEILHNDTGAVCWIKKTPDITFEVSADNHFVIVTMPRAFAWRRRFIKIA